MILDLQKKFYCQFSLIIAFSLFYIKDILQKKNILTDIKNLSINIR